MYIRDYRPNDETHPLPGYKTRHLRIVSLDSLDEARNPPQNMPVIGGKEAVSRSDREHRTNPRNDWYGCTPSEADRRMAEGWQEGAATIAGLSFQDMPTPRTIKRTRAWTDEGDEVSLDRLLRGDTDTMWQRMLPRVRTGVVRITLYAELGINCGTHQQVLFWRGATTLRLADLLQKAGYAVRIVAGTASCSLGYRDGKKGETEYLHMLNYWTAKGYSDPLDLDNLAVSIASAAFFRRAVFRLLDNLPDTSWRQCSGLGHLDGEFSDACAAMLASENGDLLIKVGERVTGQDSANKWLAGLAAALPQVFESM